MTETPLERRMAANEAVFREYNENVQKGFDKLKQLTKDEGHEPFFAVDDEPLHFFCECSDENCRQRVIMSPSKYKKIHESRDQFVIIKGHESVTVERVISQEGDYSVVEKFTMPPENGGDLSVTPVDNA